MSLVWAANFKGEKNREIWKDSVARQRKQISIFLAKTIEDRNWGKRNKFGTPSETERGMGKRLNIMNAILSLVVGFP